MLTQLKNIPPEQLAEILELVYTMFGDRVADPDVHPMIFHHQVRLALYERQVNATNQTS